MNWEKKGLIYTPHFDNTWKDNSALTPTPILIDKSIIRVYAGFRDTNGISRIGYVDLDAKNPVKIIKVSEKPVLDIGKSGNFDDNGVILGDVIRKGDELLMYYVGFQLVKKVKFLAYTGLAISKNNGESFKRVQETPVLDRKDNSQFFNAIHSVIYDGEKYKCWLGAGSSWQEINGVDYPSYNVKYVESGDGINFYSKSVDCLQFKSKNEYRIGRPRVWKINETYKMIFTWGDKQGNYQMGYAESRNGIDWDRDDQKLNFLPSQNESWDSNWVSYGVPIEVEGKIYMFYNGNNMGREGFGLAILKNI
tara:strand:+ start:7897 stop:8817 length:921 start_codon:yes stop_codon:yes gene_type:complete